MKRIAIFALAIPAVLVLASCAPFFAKGGDALDENEGKTEITLDRLYSRPYLWGTSPSSGIWSHDGKCFAFLWNTEGERLRDLYLVQAPDGEPMRLTSMKDFEPIPIEDDERTDEEKYDDEHYDNGIGQVVWSPDNRHIAFVYRDDIYLVDAVEKATPVPLFRTTESESYIAFSEDGKYLSYKQGVNLMLRDMGTGAIRQLTNVSKENQAISWYVWSPDSKKIWVHLADRSSQKEIILPDYTPQYVKTKTVRRSFVGESLTTGKNGVIGIEGGLVKWMDDWEEENFVYNLIWSPDGKRFLLSEVTRDYRNWKLHLIDAETLKGEVLVEETKKRYFTIIQTAFSKDGKTVFFISSRDGYNHLYSVPSEGGERIKTQTKGIFFWYKPRRPRVAGIKPTQLTSGEWDVRNFIRPKDSEDLFYNSYEIDPTWQTPFKLSPDGKTKTRLALDDGTCTVRPSRDGRQAMLGYSTPMKPWEYYWVDTSSPVEMNRITHSPIDGFEDVPLVESEHITFVNSADGKKIHGYLMVPPEMEPGAKSPAIVSHAYANSAKYQWTHVWDHYMASRGFVIMRVDFRASFGYGEDFHTGYFHEIGIVDVGEAVSAAEYLKSLDFVDGDRLGFWGWSYGGFLTNMVMFTAPDVFKAGVAVAPVNEWKNYNEWYTRQRLDLPEDDEDLYKRTSPVYLAEGLKGQLLIIHGMQDDNVLFQDTVQLVQKLLEANKPFDVMFYPKDGHGISRDESRKDVMKRIARFFQRHIGGPGPSSDE